MAVPASRSISSSSSGAEVDRCWSAWSSSEAAVDGVRHPFAVGLIACVTVVRAASLRHALLSAPLRQRDLRARLLGSSMSSPGTIRLASSDRSWFSLASTIRLQ